MPRHLQHHVVADRATHDFQRFAVALGVETVAAVGLADVHVEHRGAGFAAAFAVAASFSDVIGSARWSDGCLSEIEAAGLGALV